MKKGHSEPVNTPLRTATAFAFLVASSCDAKPDAAENSSANSENTEPSAAASGTDAAATGSASPAAVDEPSTLPEESWCGKIDSALVQATMGRKVDKSFGVFDDTASGKRLRCEWQSPTIGSLTIMLYPTPTFWNVVVQGDDVGNYPEPFEAWARARPDDPEAKLARRGMPATGFAYRLGEGMTVDISVIAGKETTDEKLVELGRAVVAALE